MLKTTHSDSDAPRKESLKKPSYYHKVIPKKYKKKYMDFVLRTAALIEQVLDSFGITTRVGEVNNRPNDIEFALEIALGTRISDILALDKDLALGLAIPPDKLKIIAPIPGRSLIGIYLPYPDYEHWVISKKTIEEPKQIETKRNDFEKTWELIRAGISFVFYSISRLFLAIANFIYRQEW